jgi:hypothetical protein
MSAFGRSDRLETTYSVEKLEIAKAANFREMRIQSKKPSNSRL